MYSIIPYYGSITSEKPNLVRPDLSLTTRITLPSNLYHQLLNQIPTTQGYHMHTDRYYISITLIEELKKLKCHLTGTIKINEKKKVFLLY